ncbi:MAG TPA: YihY family inner membrane protein [Ramlibacter sp.]|nr:YihY family inner membrane protein [Ramlibacter sp.]
MDARQLIANLSRFPWATTALTLRERFREDRLGLTASSLTFTTTIALVPFFTVALAVFTAFPMFGKLQSALQGWLVQSLIPDTIARQVLGYLTQFAGKASRLGAFGLAALFVTALALVLTIDRTLNGIWRVKRQRSLAQRVLVYWAFMTLGPLLLGASLSISSYVISASRGLVAAVPGALGVILDVVEFALLAAGLAGLYRFVPNTPVRWAHAWSGALFAAVGIEVAKKLLAVYIGTVPTYSAVYGAFATVPILLVWIYMAWVIVLLGAVIAAYLPSLLAGVSRRASGHGWQFQLALEILQALQRARSGAARGLTVPQLVESLEIDSLQLEPVLETLTSLDWIGRLNESEDEQDTRYVMLADVQSTALEPLIRHLLLPHSQASDKLWKSGQLSGMYLKDVL